MYNKTRHLLLLAIIGIIYDVDRKRVFPVTEFPTVISSGHYGPLWGIILLLYDEANDNNLSQSHIVIGFCRRRNELFRLKIFLQQFHNNSLNPSLQIKNVRSKKNKWSLVMHIEINQFLYIPLIILVDIDQTCR